MLTEKNSNIISPPEEPTFVTRLLCELPGKYARAYRMLSDIDRQSISEIRIRAQCPCSFTCNGRNIPMRDIDGQIVKSTQSEIESILEELCDGSVYAYARQMKEGYIPFRGTRIGIGGTGYTAVDGLYCVTSLSIRVPMYKDSAADEIVSYIKKKGFCNSMGIITVSPPNMGKTTFLKSFAGALSRTDGFGMRVAVLDERGELSDDRMSRNCLCDVISGIPKTTALEMAIRSLSPQVIVLDEIGSNCEAELLETAFCKGVYIAASIHGNEIRDLFRYDALCRALRRGVFKTAYLLKGPEQGWNGEIVDISEYGEA